MLVQQTWNSQRFVNKVLQKIWPIFPPPLIIYCMKNIQVGPKSHANVGKSSAKIVYKQLSIRVFMKLWLNNSRGITLTNSISGKQIQIFSFSRISGLK